MSIFIIHNEGISLVKKIYIPLSYKTFIESFVWLDLCCIIQEDVSHCWSQKRFCRFLLLNKCNVSLVTICVSIVIINRLSSEVTTFSNTTMRLVHQRADICIFFNVVVLTKSWGWGGCWVCVRVGVGVRVGVCVCGSGCVCGGGVGGGSVFVCVCVWFFLLFIIIINT